MHDTLLLDKNVGGEDSALIHKQSATEESFYARETNYSHGSVLLTQLVTMHASCIETLQLRTSSHVTWKPRSSALE